MPNGERPLAGAALSGAAWTSAGRFVAKASGIAGTVVLARQLAPEMFGLVASVLAVTELVKACTGVGVGPAVIQREDFEDADLDLAWTVDHFLAGLLRTIVVYLSAPLVAAFFREPDLVPLTRALSLVYLMKILENPAMVHFSRRLEFRRRSLLLSAGAVARAAVVIPLAFWWGDVRVLVAGALAEPFARAVMSHILLRRRPRFRLDLGRLRTYFGFSRWMLGLEILRVIRNQMDRLLLGRMLGAVHLGYYQVGGRFSSELTGEVHQILTKPLFPVYARMQNDPERLRRAYLEILGVVLFFTAPACVGLALLADPLVRVVLGAQWAPAIPVMRVLAIAGLLQVFTSTIRPILYGSGHVRLDFRGHLFYILLAAPLLVLFLAAYGTATGAALAMLATRGILLPYWAALLRKAVGLRARDMAATAAWPILLTAAMAGVVLGVGWQWRSAAPVVRLGGMLFSGVVVYGALVYLLHRRRPVPALLRLHGLLREAAAGLRKR